MSEAAQKKKQLLEIAGRLKENFDGIDYVIDDIIRRIEIWWCYPEFLTRPTIINLWGMTGVGKTALIRNLVAELDLLDKYCNIELDNTKIDPMLGFKIMGSNHSILSRLYTFDIRPQDRAVLLLDEMQRHRTITPDGQDIKNDRYDDMWKLLSDGRLGDDQFKISFLRDQISALQDALSEPRDDASKRLEDMRKLVAANGGDPQRIRPRSVVDVHTLYKLFSFSDDDIQTMTLGRMANSPETMTKAIMDQFQFNNSGGSNFVSIFKACELEIQLTILQRKLDEMIRMSRNFERDDTVYSKLLIFNSGNMDRVYKHSQKIDETNDEAIYEHSCTITVKDIKEELLKMFRPEQVSRLGNNHIIYRSLRLKNFKNIVFKETKKYIENASSKYGIEIELDPEIVWKRVEEEGIFPAQGVRPIYSSSNYALGELVPPLLVKAREEGLTKVVYKE